MNLLTIPDLLEQKGARLRSNRRADCPECGRRRTVSFTAELYFCHGCGWKGNGITLARQLNIPIAKPTAGEMRHREAIRKQAIKFQAWWRERLDFYREVLAILNDLERTCRTIGEKCIAAGEETPEWIWSELYFVLENRPHFEQQYDLFMAPERNGERLLEIYSGKAEAVAA